MVIPVVVILDHVPQVPLRVPGFPDRFNVFYFSFKHFSNYLWDGFESSLAFSAEYDFELSEVEPG